MTLKELREKKKLTQKECASIAGISLRSYIDYESSSDINSSKYRTIFEKIESYISIDEYTFNTSVTIGNDLKNLIKPVEGFKRRFCYNDIKDKLNKDINGKVILLYGLRRTGKTTLIMQLISELNIKEATYLKMDVKYDMSMLIKDIKALWNYGVKYVFIDEITLLEDFIDSASVLSDIYSMMGMKIVLSGTDSLSLLATTKDQLYDRYYIFHTSYIPFKEFSFLLNINDIDKYIEYGGTLKSENISFDDVDSKNDEVSFANDESTRKYIDSAITRNITRTIKNSNESHSYGYLKELDDNNELVNAINRVINDANHKFLIKVIDSTFKSRDLGSSKQLLLRSDNDDTRTVLYDIDTEEVLNKMKDILDIKEKEERRVDIKDEALEELKRFLKELDLISEINIVHENGLVEEYVIFTQPGMRFAITKALIFSIMKDPYFLTLNVQVREYVTNKILDDVKGKMLEDIVLFEASSSLNKKHFDVFKFQFLMGGEIDMVILNKDTYNIDLYEVKHRNIAIYEEQCRSLINEEYQQILTCRYGPINKKSVLYRGDNKTVEDVSYIKVEEYLKTI